jgi:hemoglobin
MTLLVLAFGAQARAAKATLFEAMGGESVLRTAVDRFAELVVADDRINFTFADADMAKFKKLLFEQLCELSGGPCRYTGRDMRTSHAKMKLKTAEFNALAEDLYIALGKAGVAYRQQNKLMKLLAPLQRDIVQSSKATSASTPPLTPTSTSAPTPTPTP